MYKIVQGSPGDMVSDNIFVAILARGSCRLGPVQKNVIGYVNAAAIDGLKKLLPSQSVFRQGLL